MQCRRTLRRLLRRDLLLARPNATFIVAAAAQLADHGPEGVVEGLDAFCGENFLTIRSQSKSSAVIFNEILLDTLLEELAVRLQKGVALALRRVQEDHRQNEAILTVDSRIWVSAGQDGS